MDNYDELFKKDEKGEMMKLLDEIQSDSHELEDIADQSWKDSEDYEKMDELRMRIDLNIAIVKKFLKEKY